MFGAGGLEGQNYVWNAAPSGLTLGITLVQNISTDDIVGAPGAHYKVDKYGWIGCAGVESPLFFTSTKGRIKSAADLKVTKNLKFTGMERTAMHSLWSMSIAWLLDLDAKVLTGLSIADTELLILRGEADGSITSPTRFFRGLKAGDQKGLLVITPDGKRNPTVPDLPELRELTKLDAEKMKYYQLTSVVLTNSGKSIFTTPGIPQERLQFLRDTFTWITKQEKFNRDMETMMGYAPIQYKSGKELDEEAASIIANRTYLKDRFQFLLKRYTD